MGQNKGKYKLVSYLIFPVGLRQLSSISEVQCALLIFQQKDSFKHQTPAYLDFLCEEYDS